MSQPLITVADTSLQIRRTFATSIHHLFDCFTDPALLCRWWGPAGTRCPVAEVDLTVGGGYRLEILSDSGVMSAVNGEYLTIDRPDRLVFTWYWDAAPEEISRVTLNFRAIAENESELHLSHEYFPDSDRATLHGSGWASSLDCLAAVIGEKS